MIPSRTSRLLHVEVQQRRGVVYGATLHHGRGRLVRVETLLGRGLPRTILVGMPDAVAREARERLPAALGSHGFTFPNGKVLFNLVPAQLPKTGLPLDLALAVALLISDRQIPTPPESVLLLAELDLKGRLTPPARATLLGAMAASGSDHCRAVLTAPESAAEAALAPGVRAYGLRNLGEVAEWIRDPQSFEAASPAHVVSETSPLRLDAVRGQAAAREAALIAAAGRHPMLLQGPPGTGKSLLARRVLPLVARATKQQQLELALVEAAHGPLRSFPDRPPLRAPHASTSAQALLGGGQPLRPGEISRAHGGVLFLDELPEFARPALEALRQPLEEGVVRVRRARETAVYPADVLLIATANPCPCGNLTHPKLPCRCTVARLQAYAGRLSGPLLDRFDLFVEMGPVPPGVLDGPPTPPADELVTTRLKATRAFQREMQAERGFVEAGRAELDALQALNWGDRARSTLRSAAESLCLSGRGQLRCMRVACTIADLAQRRCLSRADVLAALSFRRPPPAAAGKPTGEHQLPWHTTPRPEPADPTRPQPVDL